MSSKSRSLESHPTRRRRRRSPPPSRLRRLKQRAPKARMGLSEGLLDSDLWPVVGFLFQGRSLAPPDRIAGTYGPKSPEHRDSGQHGEIRGVAGFAVPGCRTEFPMVTSSELRWGTGLSDKPSYAVVVAFRCVYMHCPFLTDVKTICIYIYTHTYIHTHIYIWVYVYIYRKRGICMYIGLICNRGSSEARFKKFHSSRR